MTTAARFGSSWVQMAGAPGFEPGIAGPKPAALPLGYAPLIGVPSLAHGPRKSKAERDRRRGSRRRTIAANVTSASSARAARRSGRCEAAAIHDELANRVAAEVPADEEVEGEQRDREDERRPAGESTSNDDERALERPRSRARASVRCGRSHRPRVGSSSCSSRLRSPRAQPYHAGAVSQVRPRAPQLRARGLGVRAVLEEPVDGRPGAADVGAEGAERAQLVGERRRREVVRRQRGEVARTRPARARRAVVRGARRSRRLRCARRTSSYTRPSTAFARAVGAARGGRSSPAGARAASASPPSSSPSCGPASRKNGTSAPSSAASSCRRLGGERLVERLVREPERGRGVGAAAAEPGGDRDLLVDACAPARSHARLERERVERRRGRACRRRTPRPSRPSPGVELDRGRRARAVAAPS